MQSSCPSCGTVLEIADQFAGRQVQCPKCNSVFQCAFEEPPTVEPIFSTTRRGGRNSGPPPIKPQRNGGSDSLWAILSDFRFEKFLTPKIVRVTWVFAVVSCALMAAYLVVSLFAELVPDSPRTTNGGRTEIRHRFEAPEFDGPTAVDRVLQPVVIRLLAIIWLFVGLLWIRVALEGVIIVFNIEKRVKAIEAHAAVIAKNP